MIHDLVDLAKDLESEMATSTMALMRPRFVLVGSVAEGTRIGLGNELDLTVTFDGWDDDRPPFKVDPKDPFHLRATDYTPDWMWSFFDSEGRFHFNKFLAGFLGAIDSSIAAIFDSKRCPKMLRRVTRNEDLPNSCSDCMPSYIQSDLFIQCASCAVTVSQTKMGACLQFEWSEAEVYCSMDIVPTFKVEAVKAVSLARYVNEAMLAEDHPASWFDYLRGYAKGDRYGVHCPLQGVSYLPAHPQNRRRALQERRRRRGRQRDQLRVAEGNGGRHGRAILLRAAGPEVAEGEVHVQEPQGTLITYDVQNIKIGGVLGGIYVL